MSNEKSKKILEKDFTAIICLTVETEIRKELKKKYNYKDDDFNNGLKNIIPQNPKLFYCYWILNEIEKAGTNIVRVKKITDSGELNQIDDKNHRHRNIVNAILDEQNMWIRKLNEILNELIFFSYIKNDLYFEHYLLIQRHQAYLGRQSTYKDFFSCERKRDDSNINKLKKRVEEIENNNKFNIKNAWYLKSKKKASLRSGRIFSKHSDYRKILEQTLKIANPAQKLILGLSYGIFSHLSRSIHPNIGGPTSKFNKEVLETNFDYMALLAGHIQLCIKNILNIKPQNGWLKDLKKVLVDNPYPKQLYASIMQKNINQGDFVSVENRLGEVMNVNRNLFGYKTFRIKFINLQDSGTIKEDCYLGNDIVLVANKEKLIKDAKEIIRSIGPKAKLGNRRINERLRRHAVDLWNKINLDTKI